MTAQLPQIRSRPPWLGPALAGALTLLAWAAGRAGFSTFSQAGMIAAALIAGTPIALRAWRAVRFRSLSIDGLVTLAAAGAILLGEAWEAAAVTVLYSLGGLLEGASLARTRRALEELMAWMPERAQVLKEGGWEEVPVEAIRPGDRVRIRSGEKVVVDGRVVTGRASVDTSRVTGESIPLDVEPGDSVIAGSLVQVGYLEVEATRVGAESTFQRVLDLILEAQEAKPRVQEVLDRVGRVYTPLVLLLAAASLALTRDLHLSLTLLVVACPGALVMAAPVALMSGLAVAARHGVLLRRASAVESLARLDTLLFDKTGTLTEGRPRVSQVHGFGGWAPQQVLEVAAALEARSEHPLAQAVLAAAGPHPPWEVEALEVLPGRGLQARVRPPGRASGPARPVLVGSPRLMAEAQVAVPPEAQALLAREEEAGRSPVMVAVEGRLIGLLALEDTLRPEAPAALAWLRHLGVGRLAILSGDRPAAVEAVGRALALDEARGGMLPAEKDEAVVRLVARGHRVGMVGDGVNDGPALARAEVAFAMGLEGTDLAKGVADVVLARDEITQVPLAIDLARTIRRIIGQNLALAILTAVVLLGAVLSGHGHLGWAMLVHQGSVLAVIANSLRLLVYRPTPPPLGRVNASAPARPAWPDPAPGSAPVPDR